MKYLFCFLLLTSYRGIAQIDTTSNLSDTDKLYGLSLFWKEASYNFAYFDKTNINWDSAYKAFIPQVLNTKNTYSYYRVLQRFCALLKDGHTNVNMPRYIQKGDINTDIGFVYIDKKILTILFPKKEAALIPLGSELIKVNDIPVDDFMQNEIYPYISYSAPHQLYNTAINYIVNPPHAFNNKAVHLTFKTPPGNIVSYDSKVNTGNRESVHIPFERKYQDFFTLLPGNIAYVHLWHFRDSSTLFKFQSHLPALYAAKGVIIDLRGHSGGDSEIGLAILKYFTEQKQIKGSAWKTPAHIAAYKAWGGFYQLTDTLNRSEKEKQRLKKSFEVANRKYWVGEDASVYENNQDTPRIKAPLIVLIDNWTGSAGEDFLISLNDIKGRGTTIGQRTIGSTGQPLRFALPGGGEARICTKRDTYPDGREFVGYGIKPDIEIKITMADLLAGRDATFEKALEILSTKKSN